MTANEAFDLMAKNGNLVKRPFLIGENKGTPIALQGFRPAEWEAAVA